MCYFITITVPKAESDKITTTLPRNLHCFITNNKSITTHIPPDYISYCIITGMCSCDLFHPAHPEEDGKEKEALILKYKRKGWSESKIQRALADHETSISTKNKTYGFREDLFEWLISRVHNVKGELSIIVHMYSGDIESEVFDVQQDSIKLDIFPVYQETFSRDTMVKISI